MNNYKFQIVSMDNKGYILTFKDFEDSENKIENKVMMQYINYQSTLMNVSKIEITRWNTKTGERE